MATGLDLVFDARSQLQTVFSKARLEISNIERFSARLKWPFF